MKYQEIPFFIFSESMEISNNIGKLLGRIENTVYGELDEERILKILDKDNRFLVFVFNCCQNEKLLLTILENLLRKNPKHFYLVVTPGEIDWAKQRKLVMAGATDVISLRDKQGKDIRSEMIRALNKAWITYKHVEAEKNSIFKATVVSVNHEINQPLTVILNAIGLINEAFRNKTDNHEVVEKHLRFILRGSNKIREILDDLKKIESPQLVSYTDNTEMISMKANKPIQAKKLALGNGNMIITVGEKHEWHISAKSVIEQMGLSSLAVNDLSEVSSLTNKMINKILAVVIKLDHYNDEIEHALFELKTYAMQIPILITVNDTLFDKIHRQLSGSFSVIKGPVTMENIKPFLLNTAAR